MKVLLVAGGRNTAGFDCRRLSEAGRAVEDCDGLVRAARKPYDAIVLDRTLSEMDAQEIARAIRASGLKTPILLLTPVGELDDRSEAREAGVLVEPPISPELLALAEAFIVRPPRRPVQSVLRVADLEMDLLAQTVTRGGRRLGVQGRQFRLLGYLMQNAGRVVTRTMLLENVWEMYSEPGTNIVETHVSRLRAKVDKGFAAELIHTLRGVGYLLSAATEPR
jgi:two-component system OmpR family response regulator